MASDHGSHLESENELIELIQPSPLGHDQRGTPAQLAVTVPRSKDASGIARDAMRCWLATWPCPQSLAADVLLVLSELVTNAVTHAASTAQVRATLHHDRVRLEVRDRSFRPPRLRTGGDAPGGFGLQFVATIADEWGWSTTATGKVVWAEHHHVEREPTRRRRDPSCDGPAADSRIERPRSGKEARRREPEAGGRGPD
jgi:anti-sigma regulatory factor (Ser/Thr protein kinase)